MRPIAALNHSPSVAVALCQGVGGLALRSKRLAETEEDLRRQSVARDGGGAAYPLLPSGGSKDGLRPVAQPRQRCRQADEGRHDHPFRLSYTATPPAAVLSMKERAFCHAAAHDQHQAGAVIQRAGIACRHRAVGQEDGPELCQRLDRRGRARSHAAGVSASGLFPSSPAPEIRCRSVPPVAGADPCLPAAAQPARPPR